MRISSTLFFQTGLNSINSQQSDLMHLYQQIASGQRMVTAADDPLAAAQAINISQAQSLNKRFGDNREVLKNNLGIEENALNSASLLLQDVKTRLVEAGNGTLSDADRATLANVLQSAKDSMMGLANSTDGNGQYLFSGYAGTQAAFVAAADGKVSYNGDAGQRLIQVDQTRQIASADVGSNVFTRAASGSRSYITSAASGNTGTGLISKPIITDPQGVNVGNSFKVTFSDSAATPAVLQYHISVFDTDGNLVALPDGPHDYAGGSTNMALPGGVQIDFSGLPKAGDEFVIEPASQPAAQGYKVTTGAANSNTGLVSAPLVTDINAPEFGKKFTVEFTGTPLDNYTVTFFEADGTAGTPADYPYAGETNISIAGAGLDVTVLGVPTDGDLFTVESVALADTPKTNLNIFDTFDNIIAALNTPITGDDVAQARLANALAGAMQRFDINYDQVLTVRASVGARLNEVDAIGANGSLRGLGYTTQLSKLEDVDYYTATAQLQLRTSALEAAALAFKKIQATSLFNMSSN